MSTTKAKLWFIRETASARRYSKLTAARCPEQSDTFWLPISQIEHTTKFPAQENDWPIHVVTIPDWLAEKHGL
jgi:hypothetical protein